MRNKILIVDDSELNRETLAEILEDDFSVMEAENGIEALALLDKHQKELGAVLLDLVMPDMDGFAVLEAMKEKGYMGKIPVLIISGEKSLKTEKKCFKAGVSDFIRKPFDNKLVSNRVKNIYNLFEYQNTLEEKVTKQTEALQKQYKLLQIQADRLNKVNDNILNILGTIVEYRNLENADHIRRVKEFTRILALEFMKIHPEYKLTEKKIEMIVAASALHDIGKIAIPDSILLKPAKLTAEEYECIKSHTTKGSDMLNSIKGIWDEEYRNTAYDICRHHHERYDGSGYPDGLVGEDIPISAQLVSVAEVYDALISEKVYKGAHTPEEAFHMIMMGECGVFSPRILENLRTVKEQFEACARS